MTVHSTKKSWPNHRLRQIEKLEAQVADLKTDLAHNATMLAHQCDAARLAETEVEEAREAVLVEALEATWDARKYMAYKDDDTGWVFHLDGHTTGKVREALRNRSAAAAALLRHLADLRGALQAALTPLERAADALVPPARIEEAVGLVDEALVVIREELEEEQKSG